MTARCFCYGFLGNIGIVQLLLVSGFLTFFYPSRSVSATLSIYNYANCAIYLDRAWQARQAIRQAELRVRDFPVVGAQANG